MDLKSIALSPASHAGAGLAGGGRLGPLLQH